MKALKITILLLILVGLNQLTFAQGKTYPWVKSKVTKPAPATKKAETPKAATPTKAAPTKAVDKKVTDAAAKTDAKAEAKPKAVAWYADLAATKLNWTGYKVTGKHTGAVALKSGVLQFQGERLVGGQFEIDMQKMTCTDLKDEMSKKLVGHLQSEDFFGTEKYPTAKFKITKVVSRGTPGDYKVVGDLTIKETTKELKFKTKVDKKEKGATATAKIVVDRSDFNVKYGSGSFFDKLGDKTIYDDFDLDLTLEVGEAKTKKVEKPLEAMDTEKKAKVKAAPAKMEKK